MTVKWSDRASMQLAAQLDYIALDKPSAAERMAAIVQEHSLLLSHWPELGKPGRVHGSRELAISRTPFVIVYRIAAPNIEVLRLLHGAQQLDR